MPADVLAGLRLILDLLSAVLLERVKFKPCWRDATIPRVYSMCIKAVHRFSLTPCHGLPVTITRYRVMILRNVISLRLSLHNQSFGRRLWTDVLADSNKSIKRKYHTISHTVPLELKAKRTSFVNFIPSVFSLPICHASTSVSAMEKIPEAKTDQFCIFPKLSEAN